MSPDEITDVLAEHGLWLAGEPQGRRADLTGANLTGADLTGANLTGANLTDAYLYGANLTGAYLARANLARANLYGAKLRVSDVDGLLDALGIIQVLG